MNVLGKFLFDCQFDSLDAAVNAEFVEDIRDVEFHCTEANDKFFGNFVVAKGNMVGK